MAEARPAIPNPKSKKVAGSGTGAALTPTASISKPSPPIEDVSTTFNRLKGPVKVASEKELVEKALVMSAAHTKSSIPLETNIDADSK